MAIGKKRVKAKVCPGCGAKHCEECIKTDKFMPTGKKRWTWLCYMCGEGETIPVVG